MRLVLASFIICGYVAISKAHSWLDCTDYRISSTTDFTKFNSASCKGYARCGSTQQKAGFGIDTGFNHRPGDLNAASCQCAKSSSNAYTSNAPMAQYTPGQRVCLAYPAKNHVADVCTNIYIPDNGVKISRSRLGDATDYPLAKWPVQYTHLNGNHTKGIIDYKGFQNCQNFCENPDKAVCTMCFNLESNIANGVYTFHWEWQFNDGFDYYTSCWEAEIVASNGTASPITTPTPEAPLTPFPSTSAPVTSAPVTSAPVNPSPTLSGNVTYEELQREIIYLKAELAQAKLVLCTDP